MKGAGGIIIVQKCDTATNRDMPMSAIQTGFVDSVLNIENIAGEIVRIARNVEAENLKAEVEAL